MSADVKYSKSKCWSRRWKEFFPSSLPPSLFSLLFFSPFFQPFSGLFFFLGWFFAFQFVCVFVIVSFVCLFSYQYCKGDVLQGWSIARVKFFLSIMCFSKYWYFVEFLLHLLQAKLNCWCFLQFLFMFTLRQTEVSSSMFCVEVPWILVDYFFISRSSFGSQEAELVPRVRVLCHLEYYTWL